MKNDVLNTCYREYIHSETACRKVARRFFSRENACRKVARRFFSRENGCRKVARRFFSWENGCRRVAGRFFSGKLAIVGVRHGFSLENWISLKGRTAYLTGSSS